MRVLQAVGVKVLLKKRGYGFFMLEKEIHVLNKFLNWGNIDGGVILAWERIKKIIKVAQKPTTNTGSPKYSPCGECGSNEYESIMLANGDNYCRRCGRKLRAGA